MCVYMNLTLFQVLFFWSDTRYTVPLMVRVKYNNCIRMATRLKTQYLIILLHFEINNTAGSFYAAIVP